MTIRWSLLIVVLLSSVGGLQFDSDDHFVIYPHLHLCHNGSFSFEFRTISSEGLMFFTNDRIRDDFILVSVSNGKLLVEQRFGQIKSSQIFEPNVNDNRWYKIVFKRRSSLITEISLYSVALRNVETRNLKSKVLHYQPFTQSISNSVVYLGGLPSQFHNQYRQQSDFLYRSYRGSIRNLRYGHCGCPERIEHSLFSTLKRSFESELCEQQTSLCSSSSCECLNVDEEPRYQCDCSNKTCSILSE